MLTRFGFIIDETLLNYFCGRKSYLNELVVVVQWCLRKINLIHQSWFELCRPHRYEPLISVYFIIQKEVFLWTYISTRKLNMYF